MMLFYNVLL